MAAEYTMAVCNETWSYTFNLMPDMAYWKPFDGPHHVPNEHFVQKSKGRLRHRRRRNEMDGVGMGRGGTNQNQSQTINIEGDSSSGVKRVHKCSTCGGSGHTKKSSISEHSGYWDEDALSDIVNPGPIDGSLLTRQSSHRSSRIWTSPVVKPLMVRRHDMWKMDSRIETYITRAGIYPWTLVQNIPLDHCLLMALVERWRSETHTFHLRQGEMRVTLPDVGVLSGLPIDGLPVTGSENVDNWDDQCQRMFGAIPDRGKSANTAQKTWFESNLARVPEDATE
ncbi:hypothetical protein QQ045_031159 [Rhodiola kirilowii]